MTLVEYETEYTQRLTQEIECFKTSIQLMSQVTDLHPFIADLFREIETPFLCQDVVSALPEASADLRR
jgi:hypothetical protein